MHKIWWPGKFVNTSFPKPIVGQEKMCYIFITDLKSQYSICYRSPHEPKIF